jgi:uncharacterized integral membrane protein
MPRRLIQVIVVFAVILLFIVFNLENKCDISIIFKKIPDVPVYLIVFCSFILGMISTLPFIFSYQLRKKRKDEEEKRVSVDSSGLPDSSHYGID